MSSEYSNLLEPIKIGGHEVENRFAINAMEGNDADPEGNPTAKTYKRYENYFAGNSGLIDLEAITVTDENVSRKMQLSVLPKNEKPLTDFVKAMRKVNPKPLLVWQLTHSGELSNPEFSKRVCVKPLPGFGGEVLEEEDIDRIIDQFVLSAKIAHNCGADGVDFKNCHGYLDSQILRPYNDRDWKYGGPWEHRKRFTFEIYERIQKEINDPNFIIGSKVSMWEGFPGGQGTAGPNSPVIDLTESLDLVKGMEERGASFIIVSAGSPSLTLALTQPDKKVPDYIYLHFTFQKQVRDLLKKDTVVIGSGYSVLNNGHNNLQARKKEENTFLYWGEENIKNGITDMVALGRQSYADPAIPVKLQEQREKEIKWCTACDHCVEFLIFQKNIGCATYDKDYVKLYQEMKKNGETLRAKRT
ncbi:MAG: hypothetical protein K9L68_02755 [Spirochaetales bacterium]|nr:hypothetical protein [Spirochaetales bacterium]MCF7937497.1 hypothetical protein [Spirochaetales bacterium]